MYYLLFQSFFILPCRWTGGDKGCLSYPNILERIDKKYKLFKYYLPRPFEIKNYPFCKFSIPFSYLKSSGYTYASVCIEGDPVELWGKGNGVEAQRGRRKQISKGGSKWEGRLGNGREGGWEMEGREDEGKGGRIRGRREDEGKGGRMRGREGGKWKGEKMKGRDD